MADKKRENEFLVRMARELKVKEPNVLIEAKQKFTKEEALLWLWSIAKAKFFSDVDGRKLCEKEVEERKEKKETIYAYTVINLEELKNRFPEVITSRKLAYYRKILKGMEEKIAFEVNLERYLQVLEETGFEYLKEKLRIPKNAKYHSIATIMSVSLMDEGNTLQIVFTPYVVPLLLVLKKWFTLHNLDEIFVLNSRYSIILYRLCKEKNAFGETFTISTEELKGIFNTEKIATGDFIRRVLKPAVEELNEKTSLKVSYKPIRRGRGGKIVAFEFKIREIPKLPEIKDIIDLEKLRDILSLIEIDGENENELSKFQDLGIEIEQKEEENTEEFKIEKRAYRLLSLKRLNPAVAIWYLLHFPKEKHKEIWLELTKIDLSKEIKYPEKFLEKQIENRDKGWDFLLKEQTQKLIVDSLKELVKPYIEYLRDRQRRREIESVTKEIKEIGLNLSTDEKLKVKKKIEEEFNWNGRVTDLVKKLYIKKDLEGLKRILEIFQSIYVDNLFEDFGF